MRKPHTNKAVLNQLLNSNPAMGAFLFSAITSYASDVLNYKGEWDERGIWTEQLWKGLAEDALNLVDNNWESK